jgi:hypothetical protein
MTGKERFLHALQFEEPDRPPHFERMVDLEHASPGGALPGQIAGMTLPPQTGMYAPVM